jgi:hypothetical protein
MAATEQIETGMSYEITRVLEGKESYPHYIQIDIVVGSKHCELVSYKKNV